MYDDFHFAIFNHLVDLLIHWLIYLLDSFIGGRPVPPQRFTGNSSYNLLFIMNLENDPIHTMHTEFFFYAGPKQSLSFC